MEATGVRSEWKEHHQKIDISKIFFVFTPPKTA
jgi:hypothetical protein